MKRIFTNHMNAKSWRGITAMALMAISVTGCAYNTSNRFVENGVEIYDPMEEQNRRMMKFNQAFDNTVLNPVLRGYRTVTPKPARKGIHNFLRNLGTPVVFFNQVLQGDLDGAGTALTRGIINTTLGIGGLYDLAAHEGIEYESEDFGQTLAVWGVDYGPYMVVPFIGPSSARDYAGYFGDSAMDPIRWHLAAHDNDLLYAAKFSASYLDLRDSLMDTLTEIEASSIDYYAAVRSIYYQNRQASILDQQDTSAMEMPEFPDYEDEDW